MSDVLDTEAKLERAPEVLAPTQWVPSTVVIEPVRRVPATARPIVETKPRFRILRWSVVLVVLLPTLFFGGYIYFVASDQYVAEARFAVRPVDPIGGGDATMDLAADEKDKAATVRASYLTGGDNLASADAEIVANYIHSRAAVDDVSRTLDVRAIFRRPEADPLARLPEGASAEDLTAYWDKMVSVYIQTSSGIVTLSVDAFRREDALALARAILTSSDRLVNSLTRKVRADATATALDEVRRSDREVHLALSNLTAFRDSHRLIDPVQTSESAEKLLLQLMSERIETEARLYVAQRAQGPDAPNITGIRAKIESIDKQVVQLQDQLAGSRKVSPNLAATFANFEDLELKKQFAERMYGFARDGVERARVAALRQSVYLAVFLAPALPQDYTFPLRTTDFLLFGAACLMVWICGVTIIASILDHRI